MEVFFYLTSSGKNIVKDYLDDQDIRNKKNCLSTIEYLKKYGFELSSKFVKKIKGEKRLWELRVSGKKEHRFFFTQISNHNFVIVHAFLKKTNKTPKKEIELSVKRTRVLHNRL